MGLNLPRDEVVTIWEEAGGAATVPAAGKARFVEDALVHGHPPPQNFHRKQVDTPHLALHDNLRPSMMPRGGAEIAGPDGRYSHRKVGYRTGNVADSLKVSCMPYTPCCPSCCCNAPPAAGRAVHSSAGFEIIVCSAV